MGSRARGRAFSVCRRLPLAAVVVLLAASSSKSVVSTASVAPGRHAADVPLSFEANQGQSDSRVKFLARGHGYTLFLTTSETVLSLTPAAHVERGPSQPSSSGVGADYVLDVVLHPLDSLIAYAGTGDATPTGGGVFKSSDGGTTWKRASRGLNNPPTSFRYPDVPSIAVDPTNVLTAYAATPLGLFKTTDGAENWVLVLSADSRIPPTVVMVDPGNPSVVYEATKGAGIFKSTDGGASWNPINAGIENRSITVLTVDPTNPTTLYAGTAGGATDAFLTKMLPGGSGLVYSTYLGGASNEEGRAIAIDGEGSVYLTGSTASFNFPIMQAVQPEPGVPLDVYYVDAFVAKLHTSGAALMYSTYLGGRHRDLGNGIAVDAAGNTYVVGQTQSDNFPTVAALQPTFLGPTSYGDAFVVKIGNSVFHKPTLSGWK